MTSLAAPTASPLMAAAFEWVARRSAESACLPVWLAERRAAAADRFAEGGLPEASDEAWRRTRIDGLVRTRFVAPDPTALATHEVEPLLTTEQVLIRLMDGRVLGPVGPLPRGLDVLSLSEALAQRTALLRSTLLAVARRVAGDDEPRPFADLNAAVAGDAVVVVIAEGANVELPIHIAHRVGPSAAGAEPVAVHPRALVIARRGSRARIVESYGGANGADAGYLTNAVTEVALEDGARLEHLRLQNEPAGAFHVGLVAAELGAGARYRACAVSTGGRLGRLDVDVALVGEDAECAVDGLYVAGEGQLIDHHVLIDHRRRRGTSLQRQRGVLTGDARTVFDGRVRVRPGAAGASAHQENRNLLLSDRALAHTKPSLVIDHDDVSATHAATVGQIEEDQLFYLRSRGLDRRAATAILTWAFAEAALERIGDATARERVLERALAPLRDVIGPAEKGR